MNINNVNTIPTVDLSAFTSSGDWRSRKNTAAELARVCRRYGCVAITGHGVPSSLLDEAFIMSKKLFDLPLEEKMKAPHPDAVRPHRGYSAIGRERAAAKGAIDTDDKKRKEELKRVVDYKESYEIGSEDNPFGQYNIWLPEEVLPGFRHLTLKLFWKLRDTSMAILEALILGLELSEGEAGYLRSIHSGHNNQLRLLHYPSISPEVLENKNMSRLGEHKDVSTFTLLFQDTNAGLEFANRETGEYMPATPKADTMYMNIGDMFERITNDTYPAATHRVTMLGKIFLSGDEGIKTTPARYSIPYFVGPDYDAVIVPRPSFISATQKALYEPMTYGDYSDQMYKAAMDLAK